MLRAYHVDSKRTDWFGIVAICSVLLILGGVFFGLREDGTKQSASLTHTASSAEGQSTATR